MSSSPESESREYFADRRRESAEALVDAAVFHGIWTEEAENALAFLLETTRSSGEKVEPKPKWYRKPFFVA